MASLFSRLAKAKGLYCTGPFTTEVVGEFLTKAKALSPVLVDIRELANVMYGSSYTLAEVAEDITPPYPEMWFEFLDTKGRRIGTWVTRLECSILTKAITDAYPVPDGAVFFVQVTALQEHQDSALLRADNFAYIDRQGKILSNQGIHGDTEITKNFANTTFYVTCDALSCMNTRGTRIEPPVERAPAGVVKPNRYACSTWHTIHIPKLVREPQGLTGGPVVERREHMVRAHRADYRKGGGLFGRLHELIWVPEHKRGNPELGTVKQSYRVERPKERE